MDQGGHLSARILAATALVAFPACESASPGSPDAGAASAPSIARQPEAKSAAPTRAPLVPPPPTTATPRACADCSSPGAECVDGACKLKPGARWKLRAKGDTPCVRVHGGAWAMKCPEGERPAELDVSTADLTAPGGLDFDLGVDPLYRVAAPCLTANSRLFEQGFFMKLPTKQYRFMIEPMEGNAEIVGPFARVLDTTFERPPTVEKVASVKRIVEATDRGLCSATARRGRITNSTGMDSQLVGYFDVERPKVVIRITQVSPAIVNQEFYYDGAKLVFSRHYEIEDGTPQPRREARRYYDNGQIVRTEGKIEFAATDCNEPPCDAGQTLGEHDTNLAAAITKALLKGGENRLADGIF